jgi:hypothetical protein
VLINPSKNLSADKHGRNQVKRWWLVWWQGHTTFAKRGPMSASAIFAAPGFA